MGSKFICFEKLILVPKIALERKNSLYDICDKIASKKYYKKSKYIKAFSRPELCVVTISGNGLLK